MSRKTIHVVMDGTGYHEDFYAYEHEILPYPAGTYHRFLLTNGDTVYYNDFGLRTLFIKSD